MIVRANFGLVLILIFLGLFVITLMEVTKELQQIKTVNEILDESIKFDDLYLSNNSYIYDQNGELVSEVYGAINRIYLEYADIPKEVIKAFVATEDQNFYDHKGFDMTGIARAFIVNLQEDSIEQGGSTISQQLIRNIYLTNEKSYNRKLSELLYAYQLERTFSKEAIIELYINAIYFKNGVYGIEAASRYYFNRTVSDLSLAEIAFLSAIPNNPTHYNPIVAKDNTKQRQQWILLKMLEMDYIDEDTFEEAVNTSITLNLSNKIDLYPDYISYIHHEFKQLVAENEGYNKKLEASTDPDEHLTIKNELAERVYELLFVKGVRIETTLNPTIQKRALESINRHLSSTDIQGALVVINHQNQEIVALIGGKNQKKHYFNRAFQAYRQPGSAIKPLLVYAPYLEERRVPISSNVNAGNFCRNGYCPRNFGGAVYGNVTLTTALKHSYNTAAARLLDINGIDTSFSYLERFGFEKVLPEDYGLPAALGGFSYGMSPLEITNAYTTFANNGNYIEAKGIRKVTDTNGNLLYEWEREPIPIWSADTNNKMRVMLNRVVTEGTARRALFPTHSYIGGKTGTTNDFKDLWFIGHTDRYTAGVWVGKDRPQSMQRISSINPHLLIWKDTMSNIESH